jgi:hypothetical protein
MHPDRALTLSTHQSSTAFGTPEPGELLSPGAEKEQISKQMMSLIEEPCRASAAVSVQGTGMYTHASVTEFPDATTARKLAPPRFLPIGGPINVSTFGDMVEESLSEEMEQIWKQVEATVNEEEKIIGHVGMSEEQLRERYSALHVPDPNEAAAPLAPQQLQLQQFMEALRKLKVRKSAADIAMGGTEIEGGGNANATPGAHSTPRANMYHESRDPRRRG